MIKLPLTQGCITILDDADADKLAPYRWYAMNNKGRGYYAVSGGRTGLRRRVFLHRLLLDAPGHLLVDHINGDGLDNRRCNLRLATAAENCMNQKKMRGTLSRFKGVTWLKSEGVWYAQITRQGVNHNLGRFRNEMEAALAYDSAARRLFGEFAKPNFQESP